MSIILPDGQPKANRRWKLLRLTNEALVSICQINGTIFAEGMPDDAKVIRVTVDTDYSIAVVIESETFDPTSAEQLIPEMTVMFTRVAS